MDRLGQDSATLRMYNLPKAPCHLIEFMLFRLPCHFSALVIFFHIVAGFTADGKPSIEAAAQSKRLCGQRPSFATTVFVVGYAGHIRIVDQLESAHICNTVFFFWYYERISVDSFFPIVFLLDELGIIPVLSGSLITCLQWARQDPSKFVGNQIS